MRRNLRKSDISRQKRTRAAQQRRFLRAYMEHWQIRAAAAAAHIHRATIYRWRADPVFVQKMDAAWEAGYRKWYREVFEPRLAAHRAARERRWEELRPQLRELAANARAAKR